MAATLSLRVAAVHPALLREGRVGRSMVLKPLHLPKASILVLEEDPDLRAGLSGLLTGTGYVLAESANGAGRSGRIDLVLAGLGPRQTPKAALDMLNRSVPVILLVGHKAWTGFDFFDAQ